MSKSPHSEQLEGAYMDRSVMDDDYDITSGTNNGMDGSNNVTQNVALHAEWVVHYEDLSRSQELPAMLKQTFLRCPRGSSSDCAVKQKNFQKISNYTFERHDYAKCVTPLENNRSSNNNNNSIRSSSNNNSNNYVLERVDRVISPKRSSKTGNRSAGGPQNASKPQKGGNGKSKKPKKPKIFPSFYGPNTGASLITFESWFKDDQEDEGPSDVAATKKK